MSFGGIPFGHGTFGGTIALPAPAPPGGGVEVPIVIDPFTIEISGVSMKGHQLINTLSVDTDLGRQGSAQFSLKNLKFVPQVGASVRILFYTEVLFVGALDRVTINSNNMQTFIRYDFECTDNSYLLFRHKIHVTYTELSVFSITSSILQQYIPNDGISVATMDRNVLIPLADGDGVTIFEFLNGIAIASGTVFSIDNNRQLHFRGASLPVAVMPLTVDTVESCSIEFDRETYRNKMTTKVTGTTSASGETAQVVELTRTNAEQVTERMRIEGPGGVYSDMTTITHPTSNDPVQLTRLAQAHNKTMLAVAGSIRRSLSLTTRQYGYKSGQVVTVEIPQLGVTGSWVIQRLSLREESGRFLVSDMQLNQTSLLRRAQELWLEVVRKGTLAILPPEGTYSSISINTTLGIGSFQVPAGVYEMQISCYGAGGGGGGGARSYWEGYGGVNTANGSDGGGGGLAVGVFPVTPGEALTFWVGMGGTGGPGEYLVESFSYSFGGNGTAGISSWVKRGTTYLLEAFGGDYGIGGTCRSRPLWTETYAPGRGGDASGGQSATVGGAANGGIGGAGTTYSPGGTGGNGQVIFEW